MKRTALILTAILFFASVAGICYAGGIGPVEPLGSMKLEADAEYNGILNRNLDKSGSIAESEVDKSNQGYLKLSLGVAEYFNLYGKIGAASFEQTVKWDSAYNNRSQIITYSPGLLWGIGANGLYDFGNNVGIGGDIQFNMWYNDADTIEGTERPLFVNKGSLETSEFQAAAYMTYTLFFGQSAKFIPYAGGYYSYFKSSVDSSITYNDVTLPGFNYTLLELEGEDNFGLLIGANILSLMKNVSLNVECRFIAETAVTAGVSYKF